LGVSLNGAPSYATSGSNRWRSTSAVALAAAAVPGSTDVVSSITATVHCACAGDCAALATDHEASSATPKASILVRTPKFNFIVAPSSKIIATMGASTLKLTGPHSSSPRSRGENRDLSRVVDQLSKFISILSRRAQAHETLFCTATTANVF